MNTRRTRSVAAAEGTTEFPQMHKLRAEVSRRGQAVNEGDAQLGALERHLSPLRTSMTALVRMGTTVQQLTTRVTQADGIASHLSNQSERMPCALNTITDRQDAERLIINGGNLTHTQGIHRLLF